MAGDDYLRSERDFDRVLELVENSEDKRDGRVAAAMMQITRAVQAVQAESVANTATNRQIVEELRALRNDYAERQGSSRAWAKLSSALSVLALGLVGWFAGDHIVTRDRVKALEITQLRNVADVSEATRRDEQIRAEINDVRREVRDVAQRQPGGTRGP